MGYEEYLNIDRAQNSSPPGRSPPTWRSSSPPSSSAPPWKPSLPSKSPRGRRLKKLLEDWNNHSERHLCYPRRGQEQKKKEKTSKVLEGSSLLIFVKNLTKEILAFGQDLLETSETMLVFAGWNYFCSLSNLTQIVWLVANWIRVLVLQIQNFKIVQNFQNHNWFYSLFHQIQHDFMTLALGVWKILKLSRMHAPP